MEGMSKTSHSLLDKFISKSDHFLQLLKNTNLTNNKSTAFRLTLQTRPDYVLWVSQLATFEPIWKQNYIICVSSGDIDEPGCWIHSFRQEVNVEPG